MLIRNKKVKKEEIQFEQMKLRKSFESRKELKEEKIPFVVVLTDPTTGGFGFYALCIQL